MRTSLFFLCLSAWAGQGLNLSKVRAENGSFTAQSHSTPVIAELELSDWTMVTPNDSVAILNAFGVVVEFQDANTLRVADNWITGGSASNFSISLSRFANDYLILRFQRDRAGTIGPARTDYCQAWDRFGVLQYSATIKYSGDSDYNYPGIYAAQNGNKTIQRVHFLRAGKTSGSPCLPFPGDRRRWPSQLRLLGIPVEVRWNARGCQRQSLERVDGRRLEALSNLRFHGHQLLPNSISRADPVPDPSSVIWRAGVPQSPSCANSFSQADASPVISGCSWQILSGPSTPVWSSHSTTSPSLAGLIAGDYSLQLQVQDAASQTAVVTQHIGVVATDSNDIVINAAGLPTQAQTDVILGPLQKWKSSREPYPLFDLLHGEQWNLRSGPNGDFQKPINGGSSYQPGTAYFDYAQPGTLSVAQFSNVLTGAGTSWLTTACSTGDKTKTAAVLTSVEAGIHPTDPFTITTGNQKLSLAFDGGTAITVTLTIGSRTPAQIAADIQSAIGKAGTAAATYNGFLIRIATATVGMGGSVAVRAIPDSAYSLLGLVAGTYTVANVPQANMTIIPWYLTSTLSTVNPGYGTGRRQLNVLACNSDTSMIVEQASGLNWRLPSQSGIQYALDNQSWPYYYYSTNNGNYYDNILADYSLAFKTGIASHLEQARARADRWFRGPGIDLGQEYTTSSDSTTVVGSGHQMSSRLLGVAGVVLRALDGRPSYWKGLEYIFAGDVAKLSGPGSNILDLYIDQREFGYALQRVSLCALFDPNAYAATCRGALVKVTANIITPSRNTVDSAYPYWPVLYYSSASFQGSSSVCVVNGSNSVVGTGTAFRTLGPTSTIWFFPTPRTRPPNNAAGDSTWYTPTFVDATHLKLDRNYAGATGCTGTSGSNKGWALFDSAIDVPYIGWGAQPFMAGGILNSAFAWASLATACNSIGVPANCDDSTAALLKRYTSEQAAWTANVGYQASTGGVYQGAGFVNCSPPSSNPVCDAGNLPYGARVIAEEAALGLSWAYRLTGNASFKTTADAMFAANWSSPAGLPDYNPPGGGYVQSPGTVAAYKYYGLQAGTSGQPSYQAVQLCAAMTFPCLSPVAPVMNRTIAVRYSPSDISGASYVRITVTKPDGTATTTTCSSSPCSVTGDARQGQNHLIQAAYFTSAGAQLAQTAVEVLTVQ